MERKSNMKTHIHKANTTIEIKLDEDNYIDQSVIVEFDQYYDGIGSSEFWGAKCYDKGVLVNEIENIIPVFKNNESEELKDKIVSFIDNNYESICENLYENTELFNLSDE